MKLFSLVPHVSLTLKICLNILYIKDIWSSIKLYYPSFSFFRAFRALVSLLLL